MKIILTGISGFLGAEIARRLIVDGHTVYAVIRPSAQLENIVDIRSLIDICVHDGTTEQLVNLMGDFRPDQVMHLASNFLAEHKPADIEGLILSNVQFPTQLLEAMVTTGCRNFINTGTSWQHFGGANYRPVNLYAATKQAFEDLLAFYADAHLVSVVTLKLFDTYGVNDRRRKLIRLLIDAATSGARLEMSPGEQLIDLTHSDDVVTAFMLASRRLSEADEPVFKSYLVSGERISLRGLVGLIEHISGQRIDVAWGAKPYRKREVMKPVEAAELSLPGWKPAIPLEHGLRQLFKQYDRT